MPIFYLSAILLFLTKTEGIQIMAYNFGYVEKNASDCFKKELDEAGQWAINKFLDAIYAINDEKIMANLDNLKGQMNNFIADANADALSAINAQLDKIVAALNA